MSVTLEKKFRKKNLLIFSREKNLIEKVCVGDEHI